MIFNVGAGGGGIAESVKYDNSKSGLESDNVQGAIDEVNDRLINEDNESFNYGVKDGVRGFYTDPSRADDSFIPFKRGIYITGFRCYQSMNIEFEVTGYSTAIFDYSSRQNEHTEKIYLDDTLVHTIEGKDATIELNGASRLKIVGTGGGSSYTLFNSVTIE